MNIKDIHDKVTRLCTDGILRCLRSNPITDPNLTYDYITYPMNLEMLRFYWALSYDIEKIANIIVHNPRRLTTTITFEETEKNGEITGSINASSTILAQLRTLNPTLFVVLEPSTTVHSLPNYLVAWILSEAFHILLSARRIYKKLNKYEWFNKKLSLLEQALRNEILQDIMLSSTGRKRPNGAVLRAASKARVPIYLYAIEVFELLEGIERGKEEAIKYCLSQTLIANLEYWQRLELATALEAAKALSTITGNPVRISFPFEAGQPVASIGRFDIYWQYAVPQRFREQLDMTELWSRQIATGIGVKSSDSRADVVVCYNSKVVSLFECKYFESESSLSQSVLDASNQLAKYARDIYPDSIPQATNLLSKSCIVVAYRGALSEQLDPLNPICQTFEKRFVYFTDIDGLNNNSLLCWAKQLHMNYSDQPSLDS